MNVLSLFDGMSCGREALERCGFWVDNYFASEIDKYAMWVAKKNYPDTIHIGDVTQVKGSNLPQIDILIGGSPCQGFSFAGKQLNFEDPRSKLFFEFVRLLKECKPKYFFLENVKMKREHQDVISKYLGVEPKELNSSRVSAQSRKRLYWTNIPGYTEPEDKGILLKAIVHENCDAFKDKSQTLLATIYKENAKSMITRSKLGLVVAQFNVNPSGKGMKGLVQSVDKEKLNCLTTNKGEGQKLYVPEATAKGFAEIKDGEGVDLTFINSKTRRGRRMELKSNCLTAAPFDYNFYKDGYIRKLTPIECERLQTLPDNYTAGVSNSQRYKMLGNGWTVDAICEFFKHIPKDLELL